MDGEYRVIRLIARIHTWIYRMTGGALGSKMGGPILLLTTTGRKSGRQRTLPLIYLEHPAGWAVAGSNAGMPRDPDWWANLQQEPLAAVRIGREVTPVRAKEASPEERQALWPRFVAAYPGYEDYRRKAGREIPVVLLERA